MFEKPLQYKKSARVQKAIAKELLEFASKTLKNANSILDLGCGTGFLGEILNAKAKIDGVDRAKAMLSFAKPFYNQLFLEDLRTFVPAQRYDLTLSSMCLQWLREDMELVIEKFKGNFYFAIPLPESLAEISACFAKEGLKSPIIEFIEPKLIKPGVIKTYKEPHQSLISALKSFNEIGAKNAGSNAPTHSQIKALERHFKKEITWKIGFFNN